MNEFMILIWVIGFMLSLGLAIDSSRDDSETPKSWFIVFGLMALFIWPFYIGVHLKEN